MMQKIGFILVLNIVCFTYLFSQDDKNDFLAFKYTSQDGLLTNLISDVSFDRNGYFWLATQAGLSRFDGQNFFNYSSKDFDFIKSNRFYVIEKKTDGRLFVTNDVNQLFLIDSKSKLLELSNKKFGVDFIVSMNKKIIFLNDDCTLSKGEMESYINKTSQLYWIDKNTYYLFNEANILYNGKTKLHNQNFIHDIESVFDLDSKLYIVDRNKKIFSIDQSKVEFVCDLEKELHHKFKINQLWINQNNGLVTLNAGNDVFTVTKSSSGLKFTKFEYQLNINDKITIVDSPKEYNQQFVYSRSLGFYLIKLNVFKSNLLRDKLIINENEVYRVLTNKNSEIIGNSFYELLGTKSATNYSSLWYNKNLDTISFLTKDVLIDISGKNYVVKKLNKNTFDNTKDFIDEVKFEGKSYLIRGNKILRFKTANELEVLFNSKMDFITTACKITNQNKWLLGSRDQGVHVCDLKSKTSLRLSFFNNKEVRQIKFDSSLQKYWVFTYGAGIYLLDNQFKITSFYSDDDGDLNFAHYYLKDTLGFYWIPTNNGLFQIHIDEIKAFLKNKRHPIYLNYYNTTNGLESNEFNGRFSNSGIVLPNGHLAFSSMTGVVTLNPYSLPNTLSNNPITIDEVILNNKKLLINNTYTLTEGFTNFQISVSSPNFNLPNQPHLEYQIPNISQDWHKVQNQDISLMSLKKGTYQIIYRKIGDRNKLNYKLITLKVIPPWYASNVMYLVYSCFFISIILLFIRAVSDRKQRKIKNELTLLESELKALRLQMTPHYLSNSLLTLQSLVLDNDKEKAFEFIGQYGKVMRNVLEKSDFSFISLEQELQTLSEYIRLEGFIRNVKIDFNYQFYSDNPIANLSNVQVPTMIFQPFVENAILHGLIPNNLDLKQIQFNIRKVNKKLQVIITDNGVGFLKKSTDRKSYGLENIQNRLKAYSKLLKVDAFFKIETIKNESGNVLGTQVIVNIPYLLEP
jgi:ligand-binding sensor domain-containing protein